MKIYPLFNVLDLRPVEVLGDESIQEYIDRKLNETDGVGLLSLRDSCDSLRERVEWAILTAGQQAVKR